MAELVLAIVGGVDVLTRTSFAIARLVSEWKNAPNQIYALSEELHHFHTVTLQLKEFAIQLTTYPENDLQVAVIKGLIRRAEPYLTELQNVIQSMTHPGNLALRKSRWLIVENKVILLQGKLRELRLATIEVLTVYSVSQGTRIESSITSYHHDQKMWFDSTTQSLSELIAKLEEKGDQPPYYLSSTNSESSRRIDSGLPFASQTIAATVRQVDSSCSTSCGCRCHVGKKYGQFRIAPFHSLFGSISIIFFGWRLMGPRCNVLSCYKTRMKMLEITYSTPLQPLGISVVASARFFDGTPSIGVSLGPTMNVTNEQDYRSIFPCVRGRKLPELKQMLQGRPGAIIDVSHRQGFSSLHYAFELGNVEAIKILLAAGSDPFHEDHWGMPAMFDAFVRMLGPAKSSASIQAKDKAELENVLPMAVFFDDYNFTHIHRVVVGARPLTLEAALKTGLYTTDVNAQDDMGMTPLHWAALKDDVRAVSALLAAGADFTIRNKRGKTALWKACLNNSYACTVELLAFGADVNAGCNYGYMPIHGAAQCDASDKLLSLLLENGAELEDARNDFDRTPLNRAVSCNSAHSCAFLLDHGADMDRLNREGDTPMFEGVMKNSHACIELLISRGADYRRVKGRQTVLHIAAMRGDQRTFEILTAAGMEDVDPNARDEEGKTAMGLLAGRMGVPAETIAAFDKLLASLNLDVAKGTCKEEFSDAVEYM